MKRTLLAVDFIVNRLLPQVAGYLREPPEPAPASSRLLAGGKLLAGAQELLIRGI